MSTKNIIYKIQTADYNDVFGHLQKCDENFVPPLRNVTDIAAYSQKIVKNSVTFEAWIGNELVGLVAAYFNDEKTGSGFITNVSTVKEFFGNGIAAKLMKNCCVYAAEHQFSTIALEVSRHNRSAIQLYKKYNFIPTAEKSDLITMKKDL